MKSLEKAVLRDVTPLNLPEGKYHVFLTHDWGAGGKNHQRVSKINDILKSKYGLITWFDEDRMRGNVRYKMTNGIENSLSMIMFITSRYQQKVIDGEDDTLDNCKVRNSYPLGVSLTFHFFVFLCSFKFEFQFGICQLGRNNIIAVVMEARMKNPSSWKGLLKAEVGNLYVDMTGEDELTMNVKYHELYVHLSSILNLESKADNPVFSDYHLEQRRCFIGYCFINPR
jgi:hypothetical protein